CTGLVDMKRVADDVVGLAREARGPVNFFVPLGGISNHDSPDGHIHEPSLPPLFADYLGEIAPANMEVRIIDSHFNDPEFADAITRAARVMIDIAKVAA